MNRFGFAEVSRVFWVVLAALSCVYGTASAATVILKDGTVIHGEVESMEGGIYTVKTESLGSVRVSAQEVRSIDAGDAAAKRPAPEPSVQAPVPTQPDLQGIELGIMQDPQLLTMLLALQNDPNVLAVLEDPEIMAKVAAGDYTGLMTDPKIIALLDDDDVRAIVEALQ